MGAECHHEFELKLGKGRQDVEQYKPQGEEASKPKEKEDKERCWKHRTLGAAS
jgi:hypothetical protein